MALTAKRWWRWIGGCLGALIVLGGVLLLARDPILKRIQERSIYQSTGMRAEIGEFRSSLGSASFEVRDLKLYNLAEFGGDLLARVPELAVDLDAKQAAAGILHFRALRLDLAELHVVKSVNGRYNLDGVDKAVREHFGQRRTRRPGEKLEWDFGGIDRLFFTVRQVRYTDLKQPTRTRTLDLGLEEESVTTLKNEEDLQYWVGGMLFRLLVEQSLRKFNSDSPPKDTVSSPRAPEQGTAGPPALVPAAPASPSP